MKRYFITSSGTGIGKTLVTAALSYQSHSQGKRICALKPVISGYDPQDENSDTALLLRACGLENSFANHELISPYRFAAPLSPHVAAAREDKEIHLDELKNFCLSPVNADIVLIEGAGGVMAPICNQSTMLDWMEALGYPVILVVGSYLGSLSHTLTAIEALRMCGLSIAAIIISESEESPMPLAETLASVQAFTTGIPCVSIPRIMQTPAYRHLPDITSIIGL